MRLSDHPEPRVGDRLRVRARGALPYELNFMLEATALDPDRQVQVRTSGDFDGVWTATLCDEAGVRVDLVWEVAVLRPILKRFAPLLRPLFALKSSLDTARRTRLERYSPSGGRPRGVTARVRLHTWSTEPKSKLDPGGFSPTRRVCRSGMHRVGRAGCKAQGRRGDSSGEVVFRAVAGTEIAAGPVRRRVGRVRLRPELRNAAEVVQTPTRTRISGFTDRLQLVA